MFTQDSIRSLFSNARFKGRSIGDVAVGIINQWGNRHQNKDYNDIRNHIQVARGRGEYANTRIFISIVCSKKTKTKHYSPQNENLNLLVRIKFLNLFLYSSK
jgi:hypothetical protein